jgi:hypothetical protein
MLKTSTQPSLKRITMKEEAEKRGKGAKDFLIGLADWQTQQSLKIRSPKV